jgi:Tfp pilus assembly protein PilO
VAELSNNHKNLLRGSIVGGVLLSGLFGWLGYRDYEARELALEQMAQKRVELDRADAQIREIPRLEEMVLVLRETVNQYVRILPDEREINDFVDQLTQFAARSDVRVKKLDDEDVRARTGRNKKGATAAFDRVVYKLSLESNSEQLLTFMDLFENHERFVKISSFKVEHRAEAREGVDPLSVPHQVDLELETYVYNAKIKSKDSVEIPQEAQKLERLKAAGLVGAEVVPDLALASFKHEAGLTRRDVFYDPRLLGAQKLRATEEERSAQQAMLDDFISKLDRLAADLGEEAKIDNMVRRLQAREKINKDLVMVGAEIGKARADRVFTVEDVRDRFEQDVDARFQKMVEGRDLNLMAAPVLGQQIEEHVAKMHAAMDDTQWEQVVTLHDEVTRMSASVTGADIKAMLKDADGMHRIAKAHLDFNARPISFGGAVCFENDPNHAVVIINGRSYSPGESIDPDLVVRSITPASITFEFRGIVLTQPMKSSAPRPASEGKTRPGTSGASGAQRRKRG